MATRLPGSAKTSAASGNASWEPIRCGSSWRPPGRCGLWSTARGHRRSTCGGIGLGIARNLPLRNSILSGPGAKPYSLREFFPYHGSLVVWPKVTRRPKMPYLWQHNCTKLMASAAGQAILRQCEAMEVAALDLERLAAGHDAQFTGSLRLTTTEALASHVIVPHLATLRERYPELQVELVTGVRSLDINRREADIAIRLARPTAPSLVCR